MTAVASPPPSARGSGLRGAPLFVREAGAGPPVVLIHGLASSSRYWEPNVPTLGRSYRMVMPDLLGFGRSPRPRHATYAVDEHLASLIRTITGRVTPPFTLVGHSMGSTIALHLAAARPEWVEHLVLVSLPSLGNWVWGHDEGSSLARWHHLSAHSRGGRAVFSAGMVALRPAWWLLAPRMRRTVPPGAARDAMRASWDGYWNTLERVVYGSDVPEMFASVRAPLTLIHGAHDSIVPVRNVRELALTRADVRYVELPDAGHNPCYTHPSVLYRALDVDQ